MKKINLIEWLWKTDSHEKQKPQRFARYAAMLIMLLTLGVGQMWAMNVKKPKVYFNNQTPNWSTSNLYFAVGNSGYTRLYYTTTVSNTKLQYVDVGNYSCTYCGCDCQQWGDATYVAFCQNSSAWDQAGSYGYSKISSDMPKYSGSKGSYNMDAGNTYYCYMANANNGATLSVDYKSSGYSGIPKLAATQGAKKRDTGTAYSEINGDPGTYPATLSLQGTHMTGDGSTGRNTISASKYTDGSSKLTYDAVVTGLITHTYSSLSASYYFEGWGTGSTPSVTTASHSYNISTATTTYAFFSKKYTLSYDRKGTYGSSTLGTPSIANFSGTKTSGSSIPTGHSITFTASPATGYEVEGWYSDAACSSAYTNGSDGVTISGSGNVNFTLESLNANSGVYCKFQKKTYSITLDDNGDYQGNGSATVQRGDASLTVSSNASRTGWNLVGYWTASGEGGSQVTDAAGNLIASVSGFTDGSGNWIKDDNVSLYAHWNQINSLSVVGGSNISSVTGSTSPVTLNTKYAISATPNTGYSFSGWTASPSDNGVFDDASAASTNVTIKNGSVTVTGAATENMTSVTVNVSPSGAGTLTKGGSAFTPGNTVSVGVTTGYSMVATPNSGYVFHDWTKTGNAAGTPSTNTFPLKGNGSSGTGTLTANFGIASGWYMYGNAPWGNTWDKAAATAQLTYPYRGMSGVYYIPTTIAASKYFRITDKSKEYNFSSDGSNDFDLKTHVGTIYELKENTAKAAYSSSNLGSVWVVVNTNGTKKAWVQNPQTFYNVNVSGADNDKGSVKVTLKTTSAFTKGSNVFETTQYANGETFTVTVTGVDGYIPTITIGGNTTTFWKQASSYSADGTMSTSDIDVSITYTATYAVTFAETTGCGTLTATGPSTTISTGDKVKSGTSITFTQTPTHSGYDFSSWNSASTGDGSDLGGDKDGLTKSITAETSVYPIYTVHTFTGGTLDKKEGSLDGSYSVTYLATTMTPSAPTRTGYNVSGYYKETGRSTLIADASGNLQKSAGSYTDASNRWTYTSSIPTLYTGWTAKTYTADNNLDKNGGDSHGKYTATYDATSIAINTTPAKTGYHVEGYYDDDEYSNKVATDAGALQASTSYTDASNKWNHDANDAKLYTKWTANTWYVRFNANGGSGSMDNESFTYDASAKALTSNTFTKTGYHFNGWNTEAGGGGTSYTDGQSVSNLTSEKDGIVDLYAQWAANTYSVVFNANGGSGSMSNESFTYDADAKALTTNTFTKDGYHFDGWATAADGDVVYTDGQSVSNLTSTNSGTFNLYAKWTIAALTDFTYSPSTVAPGKNMTVTPVVSPTPTGTTVICWSLYYDSECSEEVPGANYTITSSPSSGASSITLKAPTASGTYYLQGLLRAGSTCGGSLLSTHKQECIVESDHKLTVRYICDNENIAGSNEIVIPAGDSVGVKAATIDGYTFSEWVLADVLQRADDDATGDSITIKARYDGTLTAKYIETPRVYFYNNLGWLDVYVTYDAYWDESNGTGNNGKPYHHMTHIEGTNIWYDDVPSAYTSSAFASWASNIAFNDKELLNSGHAPKTGDYGNYNKGNVIFRRDFDPYNTMFVPATSDIDVPFTKNGGTATYYSSGVSTWVDEWYEEDVKKTYTHYFEQGGYWKKYNKTYSGYSLRGTFGGIVDGDSNWNGSEHDLYASNTEDSVFTTSINLNGNYDYYFSIYKNTLKNNASAKFTYKTTDLTISSTHENIRFLSGNNEWRDIKGDAADGNSKHCKLTAATAGVYTFKVKFKKNGTLEVSVEYPDAPGNFQVLYSDNTTSEWFKSDVIESDAQDAKVSFFYRPGNSPVLKWKKSTAIANDGTITWGSDYTFDMSGFSSVLNHDSVYVFYLSNVENTLHMDSVKAYTGEYYIRTNCASKYKWDRYKDADHRMSYSEYSEKNSDYTHYFMKYAGKDTDVRFVVANEYSPAISDTLVQMDGDVSADPVYTHVSSSGSLAENANIRFMWNSHTNTVLRAYLAAAKDDGTQFLVMQGQNGKLYDENGNDLKNASNKGDAGYNHKAPDDAIQFSDIENWVYEANVKAKPGTFIKLYANYDDGYFYFKGKNNATFDADNAFTLLGGSGDKKMDVRVVYDFKTDRLMAAYVPTAAAVTDTIAINADIMFIRQHQEAPTAITFGESSGKLDEVKTVYGVIRLNRWQISNRQHPEDDNVDHCKDQDSINKYHPLVSVGDMTSEYERSFYFISFPFDVNLSEVIGFGTYGVHWGIMYYDGKGRAKNGYWADSEVNWKYFTLEEMRTKKLKAFEGYVIGIDPALMYYTNTNIWTNNCSNLEIYFPSQTTIGAISKKAVTVTIDQDGYECKIDRRTDAEKAAGLKDINKNRTIADSYWHCIGVPTYADLTASIANVVTDTLERLEWGNKNLLYVYNWSKIDNSLTAVSAPTFKFETMKSYLVQYAGETISWAAASAGPQSIVARQRDEEEIHFAEFNLAILQNEEKQDQTFVRLSDDENITNDFDFNYDLGKSFNAGKANIYTLAEGYIQAAANCLPLSSQTTIVPVGVKIAKEGDYTFSIPEGTNGVGVTLIDNETGIRTSLSALDYTINLSAGTYNDRFVLEISPIQQMPTNVEVLNGGNGENGVRKVLIDGLLYIVKDGKVFDAQGKRLQ